MDGENTGKQTNSIRDARHLVITDEQFRQFLERHKGQSCLVPEDNHAMKDSYLSLDEEMRYVHSGCLVCFCLHIMIRFLNCQDGWKRPGRSVLKVGVEEAMRDAGFDESTFLDRGGIFDWNRIEQTENSGSFESQW